MQQLTLWDTSPVSTEAPQKTLCLPNPFAAKQLRTLGKKLTSEIEQRFHSAVSYQRPTPRRIRQIEAHEAIGRKLQTIQNWCFQLAKWHEQGDIHSLLSNLRTFKVLELLNECLELKQESLNHQFVTHQDLLLSQGIRTVEHLHQAMTLLRPFVLKEDPVDVQIRSLERQLVGTTIKDFFPTPDVIIEQMLSYVPLNSDLRYLEPSAGNGAIADFLREKGISSDVIEISPSLREILKLKQHSFKGSDFLEFPSTYRYHVILQNPPFSSQIAHIQKAVLHLEPSGTLVTIASAGIVQNSSKKYKEFREWLEHYHHIILDLPPNSFLKAPIRGTGVNTVLLVIYN